MSEGSGPSRETLVAQIAALRALVERQRLYIGSMRASRFWRLRDRAFAIGARFGLREDPLPVPTPAELAITEAALGDPYQLFRLRHARSASDVAWLRKLVEQLAVTIRIDVIVDAPDEDDPDLAATLASLDAQIYPHVSYHLTHENREVEAIAAAAEAVTFLAAGDTVDPEATLLVALEFIAGADVVYTDEDRGRDGYYTDPAFKPDWSPETALSRAYVGRLCAFRGSMVRNCLPLAAGEARWYDLLLRVTEMSASVHHVAVPVFHRSPKARPAAGAEFAETLQHALTRRGEEAVVTVEGQAHIVRFLAHADERVAVIVPTRDRARLLEVCLRSLFERTKHAAFDVVVVDNGSVEDATHRLFARWSEAQPERFRVLRDDGPFNFSRLNNRAARLIDAPYILMLNNDTEIVTPDWMTLLLGQARRPAIGAVGALLLYEDGSVQHAGVVLGGVLGLAGHAYRFSDPDAPDAPGALRSDTNYLAVTGACLMVAREKYVAVGGLDESFAVAFNDVDFCLKLYAAGYRNVVVPSARLRHFESKSRGADDTREKQLRALSESELLRKRWPRFAAYDPYYNRNLTLTAEDFSVSPS